MAKNYKVKECEVCGKAFIPTGSNQKTCSNECKKIKNKEYLKEYYEQWRKQNEDYHKQWYKQNKEYKKDYDKQWRKRNEEYSKQWYKQNKEHRKEYSKQWREQNKEHKKEYNKQWYKKNKEHCKEYNREYHRTKYNTDLQYKLTDWSRRQIGRCLKYISTDKTKTEHTFDILGYTTEQLKQRLEMNFKQDMTWENHGTLWHIDHIKPLCKFNFTLSDGTPNYEQIRLANSLANLQPLYVTENLSKGGR